MLLFFIGFIFCWLAIATFVFTEAYYNDTFSKLDPWKFYVIVWPVVPFLLVYIAVRRV